MQYSRVKKSPIMKLYPKLFFSLILILTACENNADINEVAQFPLEENPSSVLEESNKISYEESLSKWIELKRTNGNSYIYQTTFISWVGFGNTTELKIIENKVVARNYRAFTDMRPFKSVTWPHLGFGFVTGAGPLFRLGVQGKS